VKGVALLLPIDPLESRDSHRRPDNAIGFVAKLEKLLHSHTLRPHLTPYWFAPGILVTTF
jgi:hypothetical protein